MEKYGKYGKNMTFSDAPKSPALTIINMPRSSVIKFVFVQK